MNDYSKQRWEKLSAILGDEAVPLSERMDSAFDMLEAEIREAFRRGAQMAYRERRPDARTRTETRSRGGRSALHAGMLQPVDNGETAP